MSTVAESANLTDLDFDRRCEKPGGCDVPASYAIWCDHHSQGCPYWSYRCDIHRNMLLLETSRLVDHLVKGGTAYCGRCDEVITGTKIEDHFRAMPL